MSKKARERKKIAKKAAKKSNKIVKKKSTSRVTVDKWKLKQWYDIVAPTLFEEKIVGETPSADPKNLVNRRLPLQLSKLTGKYDEMGLYGKVFLRTTEVKGNRIMTKLMGHELSNGYLNTLVRRRRSAVDDVIDVTCKDGLQIRVKMLVVTFNKVSATKKTAIRLITRDLIKERAGKEDLGEFFNNLIGNKVTGSIKSKVKKIAPIKNVVIRKTEVKGTTVRVKRN